MMPRVFKITIAVALLLSCAHGSPQEAGGCGAGLSKAAIIQAARRYMAVAYPAVALDTLNPVIQSGVGAHGCDYAVILPHDGQAAVEDIVIVIDRYGHVLNLPECCDLGDCPDACTKPSTKKH